MSLLPAVLYYTEQDRAFAVLNMAVALPGLLASAVVLAAMLQSPSSHPTYYLLANYTLSSLMVTGVNLVYTLTNLASGGWRFNQTGCIANHILAFITVSVSGLTLTAITLERYLCFFYRYYLTVRMTFVWLALIWVFSSTLAFLPLMLSITSATISVQPSKLLCLFTWSSHDSVMLTISSIVLLFITTLVTLLVFAYAHIVYTYTQLLLTASQNAAKNGEGLSQEREREQQSNETVLLRKAIAITLSFVIGWTPYLVLIVASMVQGQPVSPFFDSVCVILAMVSSVLSPFLLYYFDPRIKLSVKRLFGWQEPLSSPTKSSLHSGSERPASKADDTPIGRRMTLARPEAMNELQTVRLT
ncbi:hypothetical protein HDV03_002070 [Kappamyces sp. JEL0829]|nr:hypothetical protein HDV03_002070 [Kappamyces sp. JEL0829]